MPLASANAIQISGVSTPVVSRVIDGFRSYIVHTAVYRQGENSWRVAVIDAQSNGQLYQYVVQIDPNGSLSADLVSTHGFPAKLCDVAFDSKGDLMLTCLNGYLYGKQWFKDAVDKLFRNKCYMLTFGADMSALHGAVDPSGRLGTVLADFGNRLERSARVVRKLR